MILKISNGGIFVRTETKEKLKKLLDLLREKGFIVDNEKKKIFSKSVIKEISENIKDKLYIVFNRKDKRVLYGNIDDIDDDIIDEKIAVKKSIKENEKILTPLNMDNLNKLLLIHSLEYGEIK